MTVSFVASQEPENVTIESDSSEPTIPYGLGNQRPIVSLSLNDLNLPLNPFNVLNTMVVKQPDEQHSPQSSEPSKPSLIPTPPVILCTTEGWETPHTTTNDAIFYSEVESRRVYWDTSSIDTFGSNEPRTIFIT